MEQFHIVTCGSPDHPLVITGIKIQCYVLENETRIITQNGLIKVLGVSNERGDTEGIMLTKFLKHTQFNDFISSEVIKIIEKPIQFKVQRDLTLGYNAIILQEICEVIINTHKAGCLLQKQYSIAERAQIVRKIFDKTDIVTLIDEATGYQKVCEKKNLMKYLESSLQEERAIWVKTFPDEFFEMIFKMKGWTWKCVSEKMHQVVCYYINDFVFDRLNPKVLKELNGRVMMDYNNEEEDNHFLFLTEGYIHLKLREHFAVIIALARASNYNWINFKRMIERVFPKVGKKCLSLTIQTDN